MSTTHYHMEIASSQSKMKLTYQGGKLKKLELVMKQPTPEQWRRIGDAVPMQEAFIPDFTKHYDGKITYTPIVVEKSLYTQFTDTWFDFVMKVNSGIEPKFTGADGKALKQIIKYLSELTGADDTALETWTQVLAGYEHLSPFHKKNFLSLLYVNSKLNLIIKELKDYGQQNSNIQGANDIVNQFYRDK